MIGSALVVCCINKNIVPCNLLRIPVRYLTMALPVPGAKSTRKEDLSSLLFEAIARERGEAAAATVVPACRAFQELRGIASEPPTTAEVRKGLLAYLAALNFLKKDVGLAEPLDKELLWVNAFDAESSTTSTSLDLDHVCVLFNLGVCEAALGVSQYRQRDASPNSLGRGAAHFTYAASAFRCAASIPVPGGSSAATADLSPECLDACEQMMLGNAQHLRYVQATMEDPDSKFYHNINARFAAGAAHYYRRAAEKCLDPRLVNTTVRAGIGAPCASLAGYFSAIAELSQAKICEKHCKMSEQLARLINVRRELDKAIRNTAKVNTTRLLYLEPVKAALVANTTELDEELKELQIKADKENIHVYFGVDPDKTTKPIAMREAVPNDITEVIKTTALDRRLDSFKNLPDASASELSGISSRYASLVAQTVGASVASLTTASAHLRETMVQAESALHAAVSSKPSAPRPGGKGTSKEDEAAIASVRAAKEGGGLVGLKESYSNALRLAQDTRTAIRNIESTLGAEEAEDRDMRSRIHLARPDSRTAAGMFHSKLVQSKADVEKAHNADEVVDAQIKHHEIALAALDKLDISELNQPVNKPGRVDGPGAGGVNVNVAIDELRLLLGQCRHLLADASSLGQELEQKRHLENPIAATARLSGRSGGGEVEALVHSTYGPLTARVDGMVSELDARVADVARARTRLSAATSGSAAAPDRRVELAYRHQAAALKFDELASFLADGVRFYTNEQTALARLAAEVTTWVQARRQEAASFASQPPPPPYYGQQPPPPYGMHAPYHGAYAQPYHQQPPHGYWPGTQPPHDPRQH